MLRFIPASAGEQDREQYSRMAEDGPSPKVIEAALAQVVQNRVEAVYARSDLFECRRVLMDEWERYPAKGGERTGSSESNEARGSCRYALQRAE